MNWENLKEFKDSRNPDGSIYEAGGRSSMP